MDGSTWGTMEGRTNGREPLPAYLAAWCPEWIAGEIYIV